MLRIFSKEEQMKAIVVLETYKKSRLRKKITLRERIVGVLEFFVEFVGFSHYPRRLRTGGGRGDLSCWSELKSFLFPDAYMSRVRQKAPWFIKKGRRPEDLKGFILNSLRAFSLWDSSFYPKKLKRSSWRAKIMAAVVGLVVVGWMFLFLLPRDIEVNHIPLALVQKEHEEQEIQVVMVESETVAQFQSAIDRVLRPPVKSPAVVESPIKDESTVEMARLQQELTATQEAFQQAQAQYASELAQKDAEAQARIRAAAQKERKAVQKLAALQKQTQKLAMQESRVAQKEAEMDAKMTDAEAKVVTAQKKAEEFAEKLQQAQKVADQKVAGLLADLETRQRKLAELEAESAEKSAEADSQITALKDEISANQTALAQTKKDVESTAEAMRIERLRAADATEKLNFLMGQYISNTLVDIISRNLDKITIIQKEMPKANVESQAYYDKWLAIYQERINFAEKIILEDALGSDNKDTVIWTIMILRRENYLTKLILKKIVELYRTSKPTLDSDYTIGQACWRYLINLPRQNVVDLLKEIGADESLINKVKDSNVY